MLAIARLLKPHGLKGEIEAKLVADSVERVKPGRRFFVSPPTLERDEVTVEGVRTKRDVLLLKLRGVDEIAEAQKLRGRILMVPGEELGDLGEGRYYHFQLIGMEVVTSDGRALGRISEILETGANDVYVVRDEAGREVLLPAIKSVVKEVDTSAGRMTVELLPGLIEGETDED